MSRFQWQRDPDGGFIAYPDGEAFPDRNGQIEKRPHDASWPWVWRARYGEARASDKSKTQQAAADAIREAWPALVERGAELASKAAEDEALRTLVQRMTMKGDLALGVFGIEASDSDRLRRIIWLVKDAGGLDGPAKPLVDACSVELGRRRRG